MMSDSATVSCTFDLESVPGAVVGCPVGDITLAQMTQWGREIWEACAPEQRNILWDLRAAKFDTDLTEIRTLADFAVKNEPDYDYRTAFLTRDNLQYGLIRIFLAFRGRGRVTMGAFRTMERAKRWLTEEL